MNVFLMFPDRDFDPEAPLPWQAEALEQDLGLAQIYAAMSRGDKFLAHVARQGVLSMLTDPDLIRYRQDVMRDVLQNPDVVQALYRLPLEAQEQKRSQWLGIFSHAPSGILSSAVDLLAMLVSLLRELERIATRDADRFTSAGFRRFFAMVRAELNADYFATVEHHLKALKFRQGVLLSVALGAGNEAKDYTLRKPLPPPPLLKQILQREPACGFTIPPRDTYGSKALGDIKNRGLNEVANAVAQAAEHIDNFLKQLQTELAFYLGGLNLAETIRQTGMPLAFPEVFPREDARREARGLYDLSLMLASGQAVVPNDLEANGKRLIVITGANQGGKTTFLRSFGLMHLLAQAGLFVPAAACSLSTGGQVFTHFKREEDAEMVRGKFDEELDRMDKIAAHLRPGDVVLFNESFSATNEREGSEIARQVTEALLASGADVVFVTHFYRFAHEMYAKNLPEAHFLRANRHPDGSRSFKIAPGEPLKTSFGEDVYRKVFGVAGS